MRKYIIIISVCVFVLVLLVVADLIVSSRTKKPGTVARTIQSIQDAANVEVTPAAPSPKPTDAPFAGYPKMYKNIPISSDIYVQAHARYRNEKNTDLKEYMLDLIHRYYIYKDYLSEANISFNARSPITLTAIEQDLPEMEELINNNLISYIDFAYIKARFKYAPEEERIRKMYGDIKAKARSIIEMYRSKLSEQDVYPAEVIEASNKDLDLIILNNNEANGIELHYTPEKHLFFTDSKFNSFVFSQKEGVVSNVYALRGVDGDEYAYLIVYPLTVKKNRFTDNKELMKSYIKYFKYY